MNMAKNIVTNVDDMVRVQTALMSVSDKAGLEIIVPELLEMNPDLLILSTGGTHDRIRDIMKESGKGEDKNLMQVSDYTGQPETQGGLVKTLDFKIYLGILTETYNKLHQQDLQRTGAVPIDLVVVNLYPFAQTVARPGVTIEEARSEIDIGGPTMIRAAAKNYLRVAALVDPKCYIQFISGLRENAGCTDLKTRFELMQKAFAHTAEYDLAISGFLKGQDPAKVIDAYPTVNHKRGE
jgi:phosphoribosylaminoimidazolecarboxamide formyltransferase/IMP cyclohydrolase